MRIEYVKQDSGVSVTGAGFFKKGEPRDVHDEIGERLLKTGLFKRTNQKEVEKENGTIRGDKKRRRIRRPRNTG